MVEQIGQASTGMTVADTALSARAGVAARSCRAGAVKKYDAGTAANAPTTAATRIERIMIFCGSRLPDRCAQQPFYSFSASAVHCCIKDALASLISMRSTSASLVISTSFRKYTVAFAA